MKKEVLIAIFVGFFIGLVITFGIYRAQTAYQKNTQVADDASTQPTPTPTPIPTQSLKIEVPRTNAVVFQDKVVISGTTVANAYVTAVSVDHEVFGQADNKGFFTLTMSLETGANVVTITSLDSSGHKNEVSINLVYSATHAENTQQSQTTTNE